MTIPSLTVQIQGQGVVTADNYNTYEQTADNVAQLRGFIGVTGIQIFMRGFVNPNDGGQGPFYWNAGGTGPDDGGVTTIIPDGSSIGVWSRITLIASTTPVGQPGQCKLQYTSTSGLTLIPFNGNYVNINGVLYQVPDAGITLGATGLSASQAYFTYLSVDNFGALTLSASTTSHTAQTGTGIQIRSGSPGSVLVGGFYTDGSALFVNTAQQRLVRSWFNEGGISGSNFLPSATTLINTSPTYAELQVSSISYRVQMFLWNNERVSAYMNSQVTGTSGNNIYSRIGVNNIIGSSAADNIMEVGVPSSTSKYANGSVNTTFGATGTTATEGFNYMAMLGAVDSGTGTWAANTNINYITVRQ